MTWSTILLGGALVVVIIFCGLLLYAIAKGARR